MSNLRSKAERIASRMIWHWHKILTSIKFHGIPFTALWCLMCLSRQSSSKWFLAYRTKRFDRRYGIETTRAIQPSELGLTQSQTTVCSAYEPAPLEVLTAALSRLSIQFQDYTFVDLGSGKGIGLLVASMFPFKRIVGIEWSSNVASAGRINVRKFNHRKQKCRDIEVLDGDATEYALPEEPLVIYMFNPFKQPLVSRLLHNLGESLRNCRRHVVVVYLNPVCKQEFDAARFLHHTFSDERYAIEIYESDRARPQPANEEELSSELWLPQATTVGQVRPSIA